MLSYLFTIVNENEPNMDSFTYLEDSFCMIVYRWIRISFCCKHDRQFEIVFAKINKTYYLYSPQLIFKQEREVSSKMVTGRNFIMV